MFMSNYDQAILDQLPSCLRVMPHHQNTSGFFITIIEKVDEIEYEERVPEEGEIKVYQNPLTI
jgi:hypothetical protein